MFEVKYNKNFVNRNFLTPIQTSKQPEILYKFNDNKLYSLIMYDPDTKHGDYLHWLIVNIRENINDGNILIPYKGPSPPINTGIHRYIFMIINQDSVININNIPKFDRIITIQKLFNILNLRNNPIEVQYFTSKYQDGGKKKYKTKRKRNFRNKKNKNKTIKRKINKLIISDN